MGEATLSLRKVTLPLWPYAYCTLACRMLSEQSRRSASSRRISVSKTQVIVSQMCDEMFRFGIKTRVLIAVHSE